MAVAVEVVDVSWTLLLTPTASSGLPQTILMILEANLWRPHVFWWFPAFLGLRPYHSNICLHLHMIFFQLIQVISSYQYP
ncbi:unnamed protein product [Nyctereutes procyonoides]|uniref:(raccoon dog) hypothetical protein n=1 Tax=Nyctereutes procyonoides TaxID=34880 RepID=A0A811ZEX3_NYCPR|nr:unnamed protein product [Nyctereutes procyonoides]